jgi:two-component system NarL family sensor kinase
MLYGKRIISGQSLFQLGLVLILAATSLSVMGQKDSLLTVASTRPTSEADSADLNALYELAKLELRNDPNLSLEHAREMAARAKDRNNSEWEALGYRTTGTIYWLASVYDSCYHYNNLALETLEDPGNYPRVGVGTLINLGAYQMVHADYNAAILHFGEAYRIAEESGYDRDVPKILNNLGVLYRRVEQPLAAKRAYEAALRLKEATNDSLGIAATLSNLGKVKMETGDPRGAFSDLQQSRELYTALNRPEELPLLDLFLGVAYYNLEDFAQARRIIEKVMREDGVMMDPRSQAYAYLALGDIYREDGDFSSALQVLGEGRVLADSMDLLSVQTDFDRIIGETYHAMGNPQQASVHYAAFASQIDSVHFRERLDEEMDIAERFQRQLQEAEIERQELVIEQQRQRQTLMGLGLALLGALSLGGFLLFRYRLQYQESEARRKETERVAEIQGLKQEAELSSLRSMIEGQEAERRRVAKDLHDGLGGLLATVKAHFSRESAPDSEANSLLDRACTEVRRIAHNLMPQTLALSGLSGSIEDIAAQLRQQGLETELEIVGQPDLRLDASGQEMLLRIVQELTHNVVKHAEAKSLFIQLLDQPNQLLLTVEDDGVGFDAKKEAAEGKGLGRNSIRSRVAFLKGDIQYDSSPGHGTTVTLSLPL